MYSGTIGASCDPLIYTGASRITRAAHDRITYAQRDGGGPRCMLAVPILAVCSSMADAQQYEWEYMNITVALAD